ncbi:MAG: DUF302 domain-containing protein [Bacteroidia bacterium]|nr:MAG: DUF302 domain-containing protein [Bacteroidia bacterium]
MTYYFSKIFNDKGFDEAIAEVTEALKQEGFGVLTEIDVQGTLKQKLDVDFRKYRILGACNPHFAYKAFQAEDKIGILLPCNVIVQEHDDGSVEVAAMNPVAAMSAVQNEELGGLAGEVEKIMERVVNSL